MEYLRKSKVSIMALSIMMLIVTFVPLSVSGQNEVEIGLGGPYADEIIWEIFSTNEAEIAALLAEQIDVLGFVGFSDLDAELMSADPNIEVVSAPSALSYIFLVINVRGSPPGNYSTPGAAEALNDVRFRKALAHMIDRQLLKDEVWGDILGIYDSVVPKAYGDWVSPNVMHYEHSFARANEILDEAGYIDIDGDKFRETPTNQTLAIKLLVSSTLSDVIKAAGYIEALAKSEVRINLDIEIMESRTLVGKVVTGQFDMWLVPQATRSTQTGPDTILITSFTSGQTMNFAGFQNTTYQGYVDAMTTTLNETEAKENCWKAQELISDFLPVINIGEFLPRNAYRTDTFTGWVNEPGKAVTVSYWNWLNVRSKTSMGGTVRMSWFGEPKQTTFTHWTNVGGPWAYLTHDPLLMPSGPLEYELTPRLAESWSFEEADVGGQPGMIITFNLVRNATWHDGVPFTSADVKYTLDYLNEKKPSDTMGFYATQGWIDQIETPDAHTVHVYVNRTSLFIIPGLGLVPMMPKHIWEGTDWKATYDYLNATMNIGTGPWKFKDRVEGEYIRYERNPNYYYSPMGWPTPVAGFTYTPSEPALNQAVIFDASDSYHPNGTITSYSWNFGDGTTGTGTTVTHTYTTRGVYTVVLNVTDTEGLWDIESKFVTVGGPVASFTYSPTEPTVDETVTFDASDSYHPNGTITSYSWNFGDGTTAPGIIATHAYASAGNYTVVLNVTDSEGLWNTKTKFVDVAELQAPPPEIPWLWVGVGVAVIVVAVGAAVILWTRKGKPS